MCLLGVSASHHVNTNTSRWPVVKCDLFGDAACFRAGRKEESGL